MMENIKLLLIVVALLFGSTVQAKSVEIDIQQKRFEFERQNWDTPRPPKGTKALRGESSLRKSGYSGVSLFGRNLLFNYVDDIQFDINSISAFLNPIKKDVPVVLNDIDTFSIDIVSGDLNLSTKTLEFLFNRHVLNYEDRSLRNVSIRSRNKKLYIDAEIRLNKPFPRIWMKAKMVGSVSLDKQKNISINIEKLSTLKLPLGGPMHLLKLKLSQFVALDRQGISLDGRSIKIDLSVLPPPSLNGNISKLEVTDAGLRIQFSSEEKIIFDPPPKQSDSYLWLQHGDIRIGDMVILNGNMQALSINPAERLKFNLYHCRSQIALGKLNITDNSEVIAYLPQNYE